MVEDAAGGSLASIALAGDIVAAYVSNNHLQPSELPALIASVYAAVSGLGGTAVAQEPVEAVEKPTPAQIRKSITDDGIVSFLDGKRYKTLKRHLTGHGLDPRAYRERFGLPADYPMVAPAYAAQRSALAKRIGLGRPGALAERREEPEPARAGGRRRKAA
jgi:predicted transcriptional regulator